MLISPGEVQVEIDFSQAVKYEACVPKLRDAIVDYYTKISEYLTYNGYTPPQKLKIVLVCATKNNGRTSVSSANNEYVAEFGDDTDTIPEGVSQMIVHSTAWSIMSFPSDAPKWMTHCLTDYVRYYHYEPTDRPSKPRNDPGAEMIQERSISGVRVLAELCRHSLLK